MRIRPADIFCFALTTIVLLSASTASAEDGLFVLVTETVSAEQPTSNFWWKEGATPTWTQTDVALRQALEQSSAGFRAVGNTASLSKIYRAANPTDSNATAMATVFGATRVLVGEVRYAPAQLTPLGLVGWSAEVSLRLLQQSDRGPVVLRAFEFQRSRWAGSADEAQSALRQDIAAAIAGGASAGLARRVGPVGVPTEEANLAIMAPSSRAAIEAVRSKLRQMAGVEDVIESWAVEGAIMLEINPAKVDSRESIDRWVSLLVTEGAGTWRVMPTQTTLPDVVGVRVEETE